MMELWSSTLGTLDPLQAFLVFTGTVVSDVLWAFYIRRTNTGKAFSAAFLSAAIVLTAGLVVVSYVDNNWYLVPAAIGAFVGTLYSIRFDHSRA